MAGELAEQQFEAVTVLYGPAGGRYPDGNSLLVRGPEESVLIDPALGMIDRSAALPAVDRVLNSHCHEDHYAGNYLFPEVPWHCHEADIVGFRSLEDMLAIYGYGDEILPEWRSRLLNKYHYTARADVVPFADGAVFELGGSQRIRALHAPGHTRGQCFFWIEPQDMLYLADVDLTSFGPYYGDAWSDLGDFEKTLDFLTTLRPRTWATFHHIGVLEDAAAFQTRFDRYRSMIGDRERRLLEFLRDTSRGLDEIAAHRFVYRPGDDVLFADSVERRSMAMHLERLRDGGAVREVEDGRFLAT
jgi:glyoxylase-like metal-dependent hydrolase (beta-lactamase superfamily II)